jgi:hypothetical protein
VFEKKHTSLRESRSTTASNLFYVTTAPACYAGEAAYSIRSITTRIDETDSRGYRLLGVLHRLWSRLKCLLVQEMRPTGSDVLKFLFNGTGSGWTFGRLELVEALVVVASG